MTDREHHERHVQLHRALEELVTDYLLCTGGLPGETAVHDLLEWSRAQANGPDRAYRHGCLDDTLRVARSMTGG